MTKNLVKLINNKINFEQIFDKHRIRSKMVCDMIHQYLL